MLTYFKKLLLMVVAVASFILLCTPGVRLIINQFFGVEYRNSFPIFMVLLVAMLFFLISVPFHNAIIYYYSYPKLFSYLSVINFIVIASLSVFLTLNFGYQSTAYAIMAGNIVNFIVPALWFWRRVSGVKNK